MEDSLTGNPTDNTGLENEPTGESAEVTAEQTQETNSGEQSQETVSDDTANKQTQTQENGGESDDGLAKFAKSQGIDSLDDLSERERKLLKIASDNQKAYRSKSSENKLHEATKELATPDADASEVIKLRHDLDLMKNEQRTESFWNDSSRDRQLEAVMADILKEKKEQVGKEYAYQLSQDLDTLYGLAQLKAGKADPSAALEQGRREERESIRKQQMAGAPQAHAVNSAPSSNKVDADWVENTYNPRNPEHVQMLQDYLAGR